LVLTTTGNASHLLLSEKINSAVNGTAKDTVYLVDISNKILRIALAHDYTKTYNQ